MKLPEVLTALRDEIPTGVEWTVCILSRSKEDSERSGEIMEYPIFEVSVDHEDPEINLLTDEGSSSPRPGSGAMTVGSLFSHLQKLEKECADYSVFSGSAYFSVGDEWDTRIDVPLVGIARNVETKVFGFLQFPPDQWEAERPGTSLRD